MIGQIDACPPLPTRDIADVVDALASSWSQLDGSRLLITGGSGFMGSWLLETFLAARDRFRLDASVVVLTRNATAFRAKLPHVCANPAVDFVEGDVRTFTFPPGETPFVIHAATTASAQLNETEPLEMFDTIVSGTRAVLEQAVHAGTRRILVTSSGAVYGRQPPELDHVDESYIGAPDVTDFRSAYGEGKRAAEALCAIYAKQFPAIEPLIARCFAFVGPHLPLDKHFAIGNFIGDALAGRAIEVRGDGSAIRSYLYAADLTVWLWTILFRGTPMRPYNVGSEDSVSILETAKAVGAVVSPQLPVSVAGQPIPGRAPERYVPSTKRARNELGLEATVTMSDAVARTMEWHRTRVLP